MLSPIAVHQRHQKASPRQDFISHEVEPAQLRRFHGLIEVAIDSVFHHRPQLGGANFLILEMDLPFKGMTRISSEPMLRAIEP